MKLPAHLVVIIGSACCVADHQEEWIAVLVRPTQSHLVSGQSAIRAGLQHHANVKAQIEAAGATVIASVPQVGVVAIKGDASTAAGVQRLAGVHKVIRSVKRRYIPANLTPQPVHEATQHASAEPCQGCVDVLPQSEGNRTLTLKREPDFRELQWSRKAIAADRALSAGLKGGGKRPARVAVLDCGFYTDHPSIKHYNRQLSKSLVNNELLDFDAKLNKGNDISHGTHVASIIGGADIRKQGTVGVAPEADLVLIKVISDTGEGSDASIISGVMYAVEVGADIINMSLGFTYSKSGCNAHTQPPCSASDSYSSQDVKSMQSLYTAVFKYAYEQGSTVIVSTDNSGTDYSKATGEVDFFSGLSYTVGVSATGPRFWAKDQTTNLDILASFSGHGGKGVIDFAAPGGNNAAMKPVRKQEKCKYKLTGLTIHMDCYLFDFVLAGAGSASSKFALKTYGFATRYAWLAGTSAAAPHVSGVAALIVAKRGARIPPKELVRYLQDCSTDLGPKGRDGSYGYGRINAGKVVDLF